MNCPRCKKEMIEGDAELHGTFVGYLLVGWSYQKLFFHAKGAHRTRETSALQTGERAVAWRCESCAGVFIEQPPWIPGYR